MSAPSKLLVYIASTSLPSGITSPIMVSIPASLQSLDSNTGGGQGQASQQTGTNSVSQTVRNLFLANAFTDGIYWYPTAAILYIASQ